MINCYCSQSAIYICGPDVEIYSAFSSQYDDELKQHYAAVAHCLMNVLQFKDNITIYNSSRCIDDLSGTTIPMDDWYQDAIRTIKTLTQKLYGIVLYRKITQAQLDKTITNARNLLYDDKAKQNMIRKFEKELKEALSSKIDKLKKSFFGDKYESRRSGKTNGSTSSKIKPI